MAKAIRPYCAKARYSGLKEFIGGTCVVDANARHDEIIAALTKHFLTFLPPGFDIIEPMAGSLFFQDDDASK
ncbi:MAG: hypothetical protein U5N55_07990 [Cypionkella sp.]|nr:hypothetical protein [Cypionkella sp.]